jgi:hypothetical protein
MASQKRNGLSQRIDRDYVGAPSAHELNYHYFGTRHIADTA